MEAVDQRLKGKNLYRRRKYSRYTIQKNEEIWNVWKNAKGGFENRANSVTQEVSLNFNVKSGGEEGVRRRDRYNTFNFGADFRKKNENLLIRKGTLDVKGKIEIPFNFIEDINAVGEESKISIKESKTSEKRRRREQEIDLPEIEENELLPEVSLESVSFSFGECGEYQKVIEEDYSKDRTKANQSFISTHIQNLEKSNPKTHANHNKNLNKTCDFIPYTNEKTNSDSQLFAYSKIHPKSCLKFTDTIIGKSMRSTILERNDVCTMTFEEAIFEFINFNSSYTDKHIWIRPWHRFITSCCFPNKELSEKQMEICEKLIIFSYAGFIENELYHKKLLESVISILKGKRGNNGILSEIGFSSDDPLNSDMLHQTAAFGLLLLIFLDKFLPSTLTDILSYSLKNDIAFIPLSFDIGEILITALRMQKLNILLVESEKHLEIIFFLYAGLISYWFTLHKANPEDHILVNNKCERIISKNPFSIVSFAQGLLKIQKL